MQPTLSSPRVTARQSMGLLLYKTLIRLDTQQMEAEGGGRLQLSPGMQVSAEIHLGRRTVMEYLLSPVRKAWHEAGRER